MSVETIVAEVFGPTPGHPVDGQSIARALDEMRHNGFTPGAPIHAPFGGSDRFLHPAWAPTDVDAPLFCSSDCAETYRSFKAAIAR